MGIIYANARMWKSRVVVRIEMVGDEGQVRYFHRDAAAKDEAVLLSLADFLQEYPPDGNLLVFSGSSSIANDWAWVKRGETAHVDYAGAWGKVMFVLSKNKCLPDIRSKGVLSGSMMDELKEYLSQKEDLACSLKK